MSSAQQPIYPKFEEAQPSAPPPYSADSKSNPTQPQSWNCPPEKSGNPGDQQVGYWNPQPSGYVGVPGQPQEQPGIVIIQQKGQPLTIVRERESFVKQIVLSCVVTWCCCWPLGLIAFILAMVANSNANAVDENSAKKAHSLGVHSCRTSIAGIIIGVILIVTYIVLKVVYGVSNDPY